MDKKTKLDIKNKSISLKKIINVLSKEPEFRAESLKRWASELMNSFENFKKR